MEKAENKEDEIVKNMTKEIIKNELKEGFELVQSAEVFYLNVNPNIERRIEVSKKLEKLILRYRKFYHKWVKIKIFRVSFGQIYFLRNSLVMN